MKFFSKFDFFIPSIVLIIFALSLTTLWSISPSSVAPQLISILLGFFFFFIFVQIDFRIFRNIKWLLFSASLILLILTFAMGEITRGSIRWLQIGPFTIQPSEVVKPFLLVFFAFFFSEKKVKMQNLIAGVALFSLPIFFIFKQPDLGSTLILAAAFVGIIFALSLPKKIYLAGLGILGGIMPLSWLFLADYQKQRITSFLSPNSDPLGTGYHLIQSVISVGSGEILGRGLGRGTQSRLAFLPENHTDFIFASFTEEMGFLGALFLLTLYLLLLWRILKMAQRANQDFAQYFCFGIFTMLFFQVFVNVAMNMGIMPVTGITLPLFSYGGSSVLATMICLGMVESIGRFQRKQETIEIR